MDYEIKPYLQKILNKLSNKEKLTYERVINKIEEISKSGDVEHYKNLKSPLQHLKRVHIGEKVLLFRLDKKNKLISFENLKHHNKIYQYSL